MERDEISSRDGLSSSTSTRSEKLGAPESTADYEVLQIDEERIRRIADTGLPTPLLSSTEGYTPKEGASKARKSTRDHRAPALSKLVPQPKKRTAMLHRDIVDLEGFGFVDQFFYQLWRTEAGTTRLCEPHLAIPHTVLFNCGQPTKWFFTSKQSSTYGEFQKKKRKNATSPAIFEEFMKQRKNGVSDVIAYYVSGKRYRSHKESNAAPKVEFLDAEAFKLFMSPTRQMKMAENEELGYLQVFIDPKNHFLTHGRKNFVLRVKWTPHICLVSARINANDLDPTKSKKHIFERAATFEGNSDGSAGSVVSDRLGQFLKQLSTRVVIHLEKRSPPVEMMELNFKIDDNNTVWLLNCSSLQFQSGGNLNRVLLSPDLEPATSQLQERESEQRKMFTLCCECARCGVSVNASFKCEVSFKAILLHYMMVECARERHIEKSRPRRGAAHFQEDDELDDQTKQGQIVRQMDLPGLLVRLQSLGTRFMVPKIIKKVDPRISAAQLQKAVMNHDVNMLYRTVDVCSKCAEKIGQTSKHFDQGTEPRKTLSSMSFQHDVEGDENGQGPVLRNKRADSNTQNFVKLNSLVGATTNVRRGHYAFDQSDAAVQDVTDKTLDDLLQTNYSHPVQSYSAPAHQVPPLAALKKERLLEKGEVPWKPTAKWASSNMSPVAPQVPKNHMYKGRRPRNGSHAPIILPSKRDLDMSSKPQTARQIRAALPQIESNFRPPRLPLTSRHSQRRGPDVAASTLDVSQIREMLSDAVCDDI